MRKFPILGPVAAILLGAVAFVLRTVQNETLYSVTTGLARKNAPVTIVLAVLIGLCGVGLVLYARKLGKGYTMGKSYPAALPVRKKWILGAYLLAGAGCAGGGAWYYLQNVHSGDSKLVLAVFSLFAVLTGVSYMVMALSSYRGTRGSESLLMSVVPPLFFCLWLVLRYRANATNPVLMDFCYGCLTLAGLSAAFYYIAGYAYGRSKPRSALFFTCMSLFLAVMGFADSWSASEFVILAATSVVMALNVGAILSGLNKKKKVYLRRVKVAPAEETSNKEDIE